MIDGRPLNKDVISVSYRLQTSLGKMNRRPWIIRMMDTHLYISACVVLTPPVIGDIGMTPGYGITAGYR